MNPQEPIRWVRRSISLRLFVLAFLSLLLLVPLSSVRDLVRQRQSLRSQAAASISEGWGGAQTLLGPALVIQASCTTRDENGNPTRSRPLALRLPSTLRFEGRTRSEIRRRGIHEIPVYSTHFSIDFTVEPPALAELDWGCAETRVEAASIVFALSDARGIDHISPLETPGGGREEWTAGTPLGGEWQTGVQAALPIAMLYPQPGSSSLAMRFEADLRGTDRLAVAPSGGSTELRLTSDWPDPSFDGMFLPSERRDTAAGYEAVWRVSELARPIRSLWLDGGCSMRLAATAFGVSWYRPADSYLKTERSLKYGFLFVVLTFLAFFLFELAGTRRAHPLQYGLVGGAICVFFLLLLSISERSSFGLAYLVGSAATAVQITLYGRALLDSGPRVAVLGGVMATLYTALYLLVGLEETALLVGAVGLFVVIGITMWWTRNVGREPAPAA
ncbi:MAG: cell envelope integrity protein CreD [Thermoanaerobaculia bacterium]